MLDRVLHPLHATLDFDDRTYRPGDSIDVVVTIDAGTAVHTVRSARIELAAHVVYEETVSSRYRAQPTGRFTSSVHTPPFPRRFRTTQRIEEDYVMSTTVFLEDREIGPGKSEHTLSVPVSPEAAPNWERGGSAAMLELVMDVAGERDEVIEAPIKLDMGDAI